MLSQALLAFCNMAQDRVTCRPKPAGVHFRVAIHTVWQTNNTVLPLLYFAAKSRRKLSETPYLLYKKSQKVSDNYVL